MKVLIIGGNAQYKHLFQSLGHEVVETNPELVCFTGGEDVSPHLYGDRKHPQTGNNPYRDAKETELYDGFLKEGTPMVGICRGGQFLNVMNGGRMYQHVQKHALHDGHLITDATSGLEVFVSSTHHQMMMPSPEAIIVATAALHGDREWFEGDVFYRDNSEEDYEVLFYANSNSLCFQPHPEFSGTAYLPMREYFAQCLNKYLGVV